MNTVPIVRIIFPIKALETYPGIDVREVCGRVGIDIDLFGDPSARVSFEKHTLLYEEAARVTGDEDFGLHAAERMPIELFDALPYLGTSAPTLREAFEQVEPHARIMLAGEELSLDEQDEVAVFTYRITDKRTAMYRQRAESYLAWLVRFVRRALNREVGLRAVRFQHPPPVDVSAHRRFFAAPVSFNNPANQLLFDRELLDLPLPKADRSLNKVLDRHVSVLVSRLESTKREDLVETVKATIVNSIGDQKLDLGRIAKKLGMSPRTLQRRLNAAGASARRMIEQARCDLARRYLLDSDLSVDEVASRLGYGNVKGFHAAFRRWTGQTPAQFRRERSG